MHQDATVGPLPAALTRWPGWVLNFLGEHVVERFDRELHAHGVRSRHIAVLALVDTEGPLSQRELGRRLRIDKSAMVGLVDGLEHGGYAERRRGRQDRRVFLVHPTDKGIRLLRRAEDLAVDENARLLAALEPAERVQLQEMLVRMAEAVADERFGEAG